MSSALEKYKIKGYLPTIGIECHVQLKTKTKLFAGVSNDARNAKPNTLISPICLGLPGTLPVLNEKAVELAARAAFALNTEPQKFSKFDRKHYFYPDLPKGYQITQLTEPIILGGKVVISIDGQTQDININRAHLEEDAGKSSHPDGKNYSLVDLNRAGTPLLEIVSEPDIHSAKAAKAYAQELQLLMKYAGVSEADMYQGNMRFDVNVSVSDSSELGVRTETKNLNSFKSVEKAVEHEINRQISLIEKGLKITQETRGWDEAKQKTYSQRSKEDSHDYRYFPEPDLPPIVLTDQYIEKIKHQLPILPKDLREALGKYGLASSTTETLVEQLPAGEFIYDLCKLADDSSIKRIANWLASDVQAIVVSEQIDWQDLKLDNQDFINLGNMVAKNQISSTSAKTILKLLVKGKSDPLMLANELDLLQVSDESAIVSIVKDVLKANPQAVNDIKAGQDKVYGYLVGQVMKQSKGKANPSLALDLIKKVINE